MYFHVPGVFDWKTEFMIAAAGLVITSILYRFNLDRIITDLGKKRQSINAAAIAVRILSGPVD